MRAYAYVMLHQIVSYCHNSGPYRPWAPLRHIFCVGQAPARPPNRIEHLICHLGVPHHKPLGRAQDHAGKGAVCARRTARQVHDDAIATVHVHLTMVAAHASLCRRSQHVHHHLHHVWGRLDSKKLLPDYLDRRVVRRIAVDQACVRLPRVISVSLFPCIEGGQC